jgi:hypothetical protein
MTTLTKESLAALLNGREYRQEISKDEEAQAKAAGLLVIFGASDDLLEFRGAFDDEIGAYEGTTARVTSSGVLPSWKDMDKDEERDVERYFALKRLARDVTAHWDRDGFSWVITTELPHATFVVMEGDENYCRGIVLSIADITGAPQ